MSDAFDMWRKAQNPLKIGGPLDKLLERAFLAGMQAQIDWALERMGTAWPETVTARVKKSGA